MDGLSLLGAISVEQYKSERATAAGQRAIAAGQRIMRRAPRLAASVMRAGQKALNARVTPIRPQDMTKAAQKPVVKTAPLPQVQSKAALRPQVTRTAPMGPGMQTRASVSAMNRAAGRSTLSMPPVPQMAPVARAPMQTRASLSVANKAPAAMRTRLGEDPPPPSTGEVDQWANLAEASERGANFVLEIQETMDLLQEGSPLHARGQSLINQYELLFGGPINKAIESGNAAPYIPGLVEAMDSILRQRNDTPPWPGGVWDWMIKAQRYAESNPLTDDGGMPLDTNLEQPPPAETPPQTETPPPPPPPSPPPSGGDGGSGGGASPPPSSESPPAPEGGEEQYEGEGYDGSGIYPGYYDPYAVDEYEYGDEGEPYVPSDDPSSVMNLPEYLYAEAEDYDGYEGDDYEGFFDEYADADGVDLIGARGGGGGGGRGRGGGGGRHHHHHHRGRRGFWPGYMPIAYYEVPAYEVPAYDVVDDGNTIDVEELAEAVAQRLAVASSEDAVGLDMLGAASPDLEGYNKRTLAERRALIQGLQGRARSELRGWAKQQIDRVKVHYDDIGWFTKNLPVLSAKWGATKEALGTAQRQFDSAESEMNDAEAKRLYVLALLAGTDAAARLAEAAETSVSDDLIEITVSGAKTEAVVLAKGVREGAKALAALPGQAVEAVTGVPTWVFWGGGILLLTSFGFAAWKIIMASAPVVAGVAARRYLP